MSETKHDVFACPKCGWLVYRNLAELHKCQITTPYEPVAPRSEPVKDEPKCIGPFQSAFDCPVHDPRKSVAAGPVDCRIRGTASCGGVLSCSDCPKRYAPQPSSDRETACGNTNERGGGPCALPEGHREPECSTAPPERPSDTPWRLQGRTIYDANGRMLLASGHDEPLLERIVAAINLEHYRHAQEFVVITREEHQEFSALTAEIEILKGQRDKERQIANNALNNAVDYLRERDRAREIARRFEYQTLFSTTLTLEESERGEHGIEICKVCNPPISAAPLTPLSVARLADLEAALCGESSTVDRDDFSPSLKHGELRSLIATARRVEAVEHERDIARDMADHSLNCMAQEGECDHCDDYRRDAAGWGGDA